VLRAAILNAVALATEKEAYNVISNWTWTWSSFSCCAVWTWGKQTANPQLGSKPVGAFELVFSSAKFHIVCCHGCFRGSWDGGTCEMGVKLVAVDAGDFCSLLTLLRMISSRE
jgi:hypothetical protein